MGTEQRSEIRFFREEPRVCLGLLLEELGEEDVGCQGGCRGPWFCLAVRGWGVGGRGSPSGCFPHLLSKHGPPWDRKSRSPSLPPPRASSIKEPCGMKSPRPGPVLRRVPKTVQKVHSTGEEHQVLWCCLGNRGPRARPGSWGDADKSPRGGGKQQPPCQ